MGQPNSQAAGTRAIFTLLLIAATPYVIQILAFALLIEDRLLADAVFTLAYLLMALTAAWIARPILPSLRNDITHQSLKQHVHLALLVGLGDAIFCSTYFDLFVPADDQGWRSDLEWLPLYYDLLTAVVAWPLIEELLYRHVCWHSVTVLTSQRRAPILVSAVLFAAAHDTGTHHRVTVLIAGLAFGWLRLHTGKVWPCVVAHALTNAYLAL